MHRNLLSTILILVVCLPLQVAHAQGQGKPLTNQDVITMSKSGLSDSTIASAIKANETNFDVSPAGLIELQKSGVHQPVLDAVLDAAAKKHNASPVSPVTTSATSTRPLPSVRFIVGNARQTLPLERSQLAQTKAKANSLGGLASDSALNQALQAGVQQVAWQAAVHFGPVGYGVSSTAASVFKGIMSRRKPTYTYVWALPGPASSATAGSNAPVFDVQYAGIPGVIPEDYEPAVVKLASTKNNWRLVGATHASADVVESTQPEWQAYSSFVEDRVPVQNKKVGPGHMQVTVSSPLPLGEFGVVLRPIDKKKRFSGSDVSNNSGDGLIFNSVWSFAVK